MRSCLDLRGIQCRLIKRHMVGMPPTSPPQCHFTGFILICACSIAALCLSFLDCDELPLAGLTVGLLDNSGITDSVADLVECDGAGDTGVSNIGQSCHYSCRIGGACGLESLERYHVCVIAHDGNCAESMSLPPLFSRFFASPLIHSLMPFSKSGFAPS